MIRAVPATMLAVFALTACSAGPSKAAATTAPATTSPATVAPATAVHAPIPDPPQSAWCLRRTEDTDGDVVILLLDLGYRGYAHKAAFPYFVHINITSVDKNPAGLPTKDEAAVLNALEDGITDALAASVPVRFIGRVTTNGYRELMYFAANAEQAQATLRLLQQQPALSRGLLNLGGGRVVDHYVDLIRGARASARFRPRVERYRTAATRLQHRARSAGWT